MDAVHYNGFYIVVMVEIERETENKFRVTSQIYRNPEGAPILRNWLAVREFGSEQAAYEFGLQEARKWIDEQEHD